MEAFQSFTSPDQLLLASRRLPGWNATPAVQGEHVYTFGITGVLRCLTASAGKQVSLIPVDVTALLEAAQLLYDGSFVAERLAAFGPTL